MFFPVYFKRTEFLFQFNKKMGLVLGILLFNFETREHERVIVPNRYIEQVRVEEAQPLNRVEPIVIEESDIESSDEESSSSSSSSEDEPYRRSAFMPRRKMNPFNRPPNNNLF